MSPMTLDPDLAEQSAAVLQELIELGRQEEAGFRSCAGQARADDVRALLRRRAEECKAQTAELAAHVRRLGANPAPERLEPDGAGPWTVVRATLASHGDLALLSECERLEDMVLDRYTQALARPLEPAVRDALETQRRENRRQHELVRAMHDRLRGLQ